MAKKEVFLKPVSEWTPLRHKGIEIRVNETSKQVGDLIVNQTGLVWCKGKTLSKNGKKINWDEFINYMQDK